MWFSVVAYALPAVQPERRDTVRDMNAGAWCVFFLGGPHCDGVLAKRLALLFPIAARVSLWPQSGNPAIDCAMTADDLWRVFARREYIYIYT